MNNPSLHNTHPTSPSLESECISFELECGTLTFFIYWHTHIKLHRSLQPLFCPRDTCTFIYCIYIISFIGLYWLTHYYQRVPFIYFLFHSKMWKEDVKKKFKRKVKAGQTKARLTLTHTEAAYTHIHLLFIHIYMVKYIPTQQWNL